MYYPSAVGSVVMPSVVAPSVHAQSVVAAPMTPMTPVMAPSMVMPATQYARPAYSYGHSYAMPAAYHAPPPVYHSYGYRAPTTVVVGRRSRWGFGRRSGYYTYY